MITRKQKAAILANYKEITIAIINIISKSNKTSEEKVLLITFVLMLKDVLDLEEERLGYEKALEADTNG